MGFFRDSFKYFVRIFNIFIMILVESVEDSFNVVSHLSDLLIVSELALFTLL